MKELKPCRCGSTNIAIEEESFFVMSRCLIGCLCCRKTVMKFAFTQKGAYKQAVKAWNGGTANEI